MKIYEKLWKIMEIYENLWKSTKSSKVDETQAYLHPSLSSGGAPQRESTKNTIAPLPQFFIQFSHRFEYHFLNSLSIDFQNLSDFSHLSFFSRLHPSRFIFGSAGSVFTVRFTVCESERTVRFARFGSVLRFVRFFCNRFKVSKSGSVRILHVKRPTTRVGYRILELATDE